MNLKGPNDSTFTMRLARELWFLFDPAHPLIVKLRACPTKAQAFWFAVGRVS